MCIKNVYKKICFVLILIGMFFCGGICAYAHNSELMRVLEVSMKSPTVENIKYLVHLLKEDAKYHESKGEILEAKQSRALALLMNSEIMIQVYDELTEEKIDEMIECIQLAIDLLEDMKEDEGSRIILQRSKAKLAVFKSEGALYRARKNPTAENWEIVSKLSIEEAALYNDLGFISMSECLMARAKEFEATGAFFKAVENSTIENWTETAILYKQAFEMYNKCGKVKSAVDSVKGIVYANKIIIKLGGTPIELPEELNNAIFLKYM